MNRLGGVLAGEVRVGDGGGEGVGHVRVVVLDTQPVTGDGALVGPGIMVHLGL